MTPAENTYIEQFRTELARLLRRRSPAVRDDALQSELLRLISDLTRIRQAYPIASVYARVRSKFAVADLARTDRVQSGRGARCTRNDDGVLIAGRAVLSGDAPKKGDDGDGPSLFEEIAAGPIAATPDVVADDLINQALLGQAMDRLTRRQREVLYLVDGQGHTVTEAAAICRLARETVSRIRTEALAIARGALEPPC